MNETKYLVDTNALTILGAARLRTDFFRERCVVTSDVLWEAREHPEIDNIANNVREVTPTVIGELRHVMSSLSPGDTRLVDLYHNKGSADPGLIASVLDARAADEGVFFPDEWVIVSRDQAVVEKAKAFGIPTADPSSFAAVVDISRSPG